MATLVTTVNGYLNPLGAVVTTATVDAMSVADRIKLALKERNMGQNSLDRALGVSQGTTSMMFGRGSEPLLTRGVEIARILGVRVEWLATGEGPMMAEDLPPHSSGVRGLRLRDRPDWAEQLVKAKAKYRRVPEIAWIGCGLGMAANAPEHLTPEIILGYATGWLTGSSDDERIAAAEEEARAAMAKEDAEYANRFLPLDPPAPPHVRRPAKRKTAPRKKAQ